MTTHDEQTSVVTFWKNAGPARWFAKDAAFDELFRTTFMAQHVAAAQLRLDEPPPDADAAMARVLLLDQFPRNSFRGTPRMFATDALALEAAKLAVDCGYDREVDPALRVFFYLPFEHAESLDEQALSVDLHDAMGEPELTKYARIHYDVIARFGRFPHRNAVLGRASTPEELQFLASGGFAG